jgi:hypothetical protein
MLLDPEIEVPNTIGNIIMTIPKHLIVAKLRERGKPERADFVDRTLPDEIDPDRHGGLLATLNIKVDEFASGASS